MLGKFTMHFVSGNFVGSSGIFFGLEQSKMVANAVNSNVSSPFLRSFAPANAFIPRGIGFDASYVSHILSFGCQSKIAPAVIKRVFVNMVNLLFRPLPGLHSPNDSVRLIKTPTNANQNTAIAGFASSYFSRFAPPSAMNLPYQMAGLRVIVKKIVKFCRCQHGLYLPQSKTYARGKY